MRGPENTEAASRASELRGRCLGVLVLIVIAAAAFHFGPATLAVMFLYVVLAGASAAWDAIRPIPSDEAIIAMFHERRLALTAIGQFHDRHCIVNDKTRRVKESIAPLLESARIVEIRTLFSNRYAQSNRESGDETQRLSGAPCSVVGFEIRDWVGFSVDHYSHSYGHLTKTLAYVPANPQDPPPIHVVDSLNKLPNKTTELVCLYRKVEGDWYIRVCPRSKPSFH